MIHAHQAWTVFLSSVTENIVSDFQTRQAASPLINVPPVCSAKLTLETLTELVFLFSPLEFALVAIVRSAMSVRSNPPLITSNASPFKPAIQVITVELQTLCARDQIDA